MTNKGEYGFMEKTPESLEWIRSLFNDPTKKIVFHNAKFDLEMFLFDGIDIFNAKCEFHCTMILAKLFNGLMPSYELRWLSINFFSRSTEGKDEIKIWLDAHRTEFLHKYGRKPNFSDAPREIVKRRALWDVESTLYLFTFLYRRVSRTCPDLYRTERTLLLVTIDMQQTGVEVDISRAKLLRVQARAGIKRIQRDLDELLCPLVIWRKKKAKQIRVVLDSFNANSSQIEMPAAFQKLGIKLLYKTKPKKDKQGRLRGGGNWSFDEYAMVRYVSKPLAAIIRDSGEEGWTTDRFYDEVIRTIEENGLDKRELLPPLVLKIRELTKMVSTYYTHLINDCVDVRQEPSGRIVGVLHCRFNQSEAKTGRFSSSSPNMQNMPRILGPRECFIPRRGRCNWHFDYEQVEMKFFCHFAKDPDMAKAVSGDIHLFVASQIYHIPANKVTPERRKRAKGINFGILYGAGPPKMAETLTRKGLPTTDLEASVLVAAYHKRFPSIRRLTNQYKRELFVKGYVVNPFGRRYHILTKFGYKCLNYMCQGTSADMMKSAMVKVWLWLRQKGYKSRMLLTVHDELCLEIPDSEAEVVVPAVKGMMEDRTSYYVPITVDAEVVTKRWSQKQKLKNVVDRYPWTARMNHLEKPSMN